MSEHPRVLPSPGKMALRGALLFGLLLVWLILDGVGLDVPGWLAAVGQIGLWFGAGMALYWLLREVLPALRGRRRP